MAILFLKYRNNWNYYYSKLMTFYIYIISTKNLFVCFPCWPMTWQNKQQLVRESDVSVNDTSLSVCCHQLKLVSCQRVWFMPFLSFMFITWIGLKSLGKFVESLGSVVSKVNLLFYKDFGIWKNYLSLVKDSNHLTGLCNEWFIKEWGHLFCLFVLYWQWKDLFLMT